jgi:predicted RNase H-like HicB family nuclease
MSKDEIISVGVEVTVRSKPGATGLVVGFIREFPFITGQGKTFEELKRGLIYDLGLYFESFPEEKEKLAKYGKIVGQETNIYNEKPPPLEIERPELGEGWQEEKLVQVTIPSKH